jgi:uncharacterized membrane protein
MAIATWRPLSRKVRAILSVLLMLTGAARLIWEASRGSMDWYDFGLSLAIIGLGIIQLTSGRDSRKDRLWSLYWITAVVVMTVTWLLLAFLT